MNCIRSEYHGFSPLIQLLNSTMFFPTEEFRVKDTSQHVIAKSLQLIAGRTAQEYNQCKQRKGAFGEDRYHATAIASDEHFLRCLVYIDMNIVRAGVVKHPAEWAHGDYREIQQPPKRYRIIDTQVLMELGGFNDIATMQQQLRQ
jgi:putative transposase